MEQAILTFLAGGAGVALIKLIGDRMNWWNPKEKADVRKTDSDIRLNEAEISSKKVEDEIGISRQSIEWASMFSSQVDKANKRIETLEAVIEDYKKEVQSLHFENAERISVIEDLLEEEKRKVRDLLIENNRLKKEYGL